MLDGIRASLSRCLPGYPIRTFTRLGEGWENVAYEVNGDLIVRGSKEPDAARRSEVIRQEADLLAVVAEWSTLPVPEPVFVDVEAGVLAYFKLPGLSIGAHPVADPARLAGILGEFVSRLHQAPLARMEKLVPRDLDPMATWQRDAEEMYREVVEHIPESDRPLVDDFLGATPPADPADAVFCHNDLGAEHVLVDVATSAVTGIIDWTDAALADPAGDLAPIYRDLGPELFDLVVTHYEGPFDDATRERAVYYARCLLLEDIAYGIRTGARRYADEGLAHLVRTFT